jgi:hypothetical protein
MDIDFDKPFYPAYGIFKLKPMTYAFYRGFDTRYPAISERPAYFGTHLVASSYARKHGTPVRMFSNKSELSLLDVRFMKHLLRDLFEMEATKDTIEDTMSTIMSFGLCSLSHQIDLFRKRFRTLVDQDPFKALEASYRDGLIEQSGVRIAETSNDAQTMAFLSKLFSWFVDGFISPSLESPFHIEKGGKMIAEMIIFNPLRSNIIQVSRQAPITEIHTIDYLYNIQFGKKLRAGTPSMPIELYVKSGGGDEDLPLPTVETIRQRFEDPEIQEQWKKGLQAGARWKEIANFGPDYNLGPEVEVTPWDLTARIEPRFTPIDRSKYDLVEVKESIRRKTRKSRDQRR